MWYRRLDITDLRNIQSMRLELCPGLNYFYGDNGAGKTAVLEAVHLLARGRSFRTRHTADLVRRDAEALGVHALIEDEHRGELRVGLAKQRRGRPEFRLNGEAGARLSQTARLLPLQVMVPGLSDLVFGAPAERRHWLDWGVFHVKHDYLRSQRRFHHALRQRNAALRAVARRELPVAQVEIWTRELVELAAEVTAARALYLEELAPVLMEVLAEIAPALEVELTYRPGWPAEADLLKLLGDSVPREVKSGVTQYGPHRADIELRAAGMPAGATLSRGQGKLLASAMMLSQARLLMRTARRASVFLIDDIGAELDLPHSERFFAALSTLGVQVLSTSNAAPGRGDYPGGMRVFHVEHGRLKAD